MGIPAFYRWLAEKYPLIIADVKEETPLVVNGVSVPIDTSHPNPNGIEFDNLYLDMNGIIHPCFHPGGLPAPTTYEEVFAAVFKYIDRIFSIVRPRKLLFMAIDGVAPRAKMNQQRSRRFRAAKDAADEALSIETDGGIVSESQEGKAAFSEQVKKVDSNVITPGTEFMDLLSSALRYYIRLRMNEDLGWQEVKVILSDANVAGEGEHKIMSYIRLQRNLPGFDPNTRHCLYGLDADLIMLALASHEIHFSILRENVGNASIGHKTSKKKHGLMERRKLNGDSEKVGKFAENLENYISGLNFQFLNIWILREYLAYEMRILDTTLKVDLERVIDDFVFMCLFVGNDFLPHIPSLEISEGAIDLLMTVYKKEFAQMGGYLTNSFEINLTRVEHFVEAVGSYEGTIFRRRNQMQKEREIHFQRISKRQQAFLSSKSLFDDGVSESCKSSVKLERAPLSQNQQNPRSIEVKGSSHCSSNGTSAVVDKIKLGDEGWKERFYAEKFEAKSEDERDAIRRHAVSKYVEGICWVMRYYYEGVCSWQWFYPYHYAPFASDFYGCGQLEIHFTLGEPFKPFDQLMAVLPAARKLMTDASSPILDFYPTDFELDMNGKRFSWQAICKLPFIEESRLLSEIAKVEHMLTDEERWRNRLGYDVLCVHVSHPLAVKIISLSECKDQSTLPKANVKLKVDPKISGGMNGYIYISDKPEWPLEIYSPIDGMPMIASNQVISVFYEYPPFHSHIPRLPEGVILPNKSVTKHHILQAHHLWHDPAVSGRVSSKRQIPKSISGPQLAKLACRLVCEYNSSKHLDIHRCGKPGFPLDADRMGEMRTQVQTKKRKRSKSDKNCLDGRSEESQVGKGDFVPIINVKNLESSILRQQRESCGDHSSAGIPDGVQKLESSVKEERNSDDTLAGVGGENDNKEAKCRKRKSRKRNQRTKKGNQNDGDDVPNNNAEKLGTCIPDVPKLESSIKEERNSDDTPVGVQKLESSLKEERNSDDTPAGADGENDKKERKSRKRKSRRRNQRNKKGNQNDGDDVPNNNAEKLGSCIPDGVPKLESSIKEQRNSVDTPAGVQKLESSIKEERNSDDTPAGADGESDNKEAKCRKRKSRKRNQRTKKGNQNDGDDVPNNNAEKLGSCNHIGGLQSCILQEQSRGDVHAGGDGALDLKTEVKSKKRKQRSKKRSKIEPDGILINNVEKLESCALMEQIGEDVNAGGDEALELRTEVKSKKRKQRSKKRIKIEAGGILINNVEKSESCALFEQGGGDSYHANADGLDATRSPVPKNNYQALEDSGLQEQIEHHDHSVANEVEIKPEVKSKRKKWMSKLKQQVEHSLPTNDLQNLQSGVPGGSF